MRIDERTVGDITILDVTGQITADRGNTYLKDKIHSVLSQGRTRILIDLGGVSYVDSTGLGELIASLTTVSKSQGSLKLLRVTKRLNDLLIITKLINVFDTFETEAEALSSFEATAVKS